MQAFSEEDRKLWMEALDGKEAVSGIFLIFICIVMEKSLLPFRPHLYFNELDLCSLQNDKFSEER